MSVYPVISCCSKQDLATGELTYYLKPTRRELADTTGRLPGTFGFATAFSIEVPMEQKLEQVENAIISAFQPGGGAEMILANATRAALQFPPAIASVDSSGSNSAIKLLDVTLPSMPTPSASPDARAVSQQSRSTDTDTVIAGSIGGTIGGLFLIGIIITAIILLVNRRKKRATRNATDIYSVHRTHAQGTNAENHTDVSDVDIEIADDVATARATDRATNTNVSYAQL